VNGSDGIHTRDHRHDMPAFATRGALIYYRVKAETGAGESEPGRVAAQPVDGDA
jgi:hypothetical protein